MTIYGHFSAVNEQSFAFYFVIVIHNCIVKILAIPNEKADTSSNNMHPHFLFQMEIDW